ncbi:MAG: ankyrin repeat domain-containing protein, partial [Candidatus Amoebophilus sp.]
MKKTYSLFQQYTAYVLLISLFLQSCSSFSNSPLPLQEEKIEQRAINHLTDKTLTSKEGYVVTFYEEKGQLQAEVKEEYGSFSRTHTLPVYVEKGISLKEACKKEKIQVILPKNVQPGYVQIAHTGLMGGGKEGQEKEEDKKQKDLNDALLEVASSGEISKICELIQKGADIHAEDSNGWTSLHRASQRGYLEVSNHLLKAGAHINAKDANGLTPLYVATLLGHLESAKLLIEYGADVNAKNRNGQTPLHMAALKGNLSVAELLIDAGADVNAKDNSGSTPLYIAVSKGHLEVARQLVGVGADINANLHIATQQRNFEIVNQLLILRTQVSNEQEVAKEAKFQVALAKNEQPGYGAVYRPGLMDREKSEDEEKEDEQVVRKERSKKQVIKEVASEKYDIIHHIDYISGQFQYKDDKAELSAAPYRPFQAPEQCAKVYRGEPQLLPYEKMQQEKVLMRIKPGQDGRMRIGRTTEWPYLLNGQLELHFSDGEYGGSGVLVGPQHILTAAHNIYNFKKKEWAQRVVVRLGLNDAMAPYGEAAATRFYTFKPWVKQKNPAYDLALLVLEKPIGMMTGWCGILAAREKDLKDHQVSITGYPGDKGLKQMWTMCHTLKQVLAEELVYEIDTYGGQSGSGIWLDKWGSPYVVGVHTLGGNPLTCIGNAGVRLSYCKTKQVIEWIEETLALKQNIHHLPSLAMGLVKPSIAAQSRIKKGKPLPQPKHTFQKNDIEAQTCLAVNYYKGEGVRQDYVKAKEYFKKSAKQGYSKAQNWLGSMYRDGLGGEKDYAKAKEWFEKAANQGHAIAQFNLGRSYYDGSGVERNYKKAKGWFKKSAGQGYANSQNWLAYMYRNGQGIEKDYAKAKEWFEKAANQGNTDAQDWLGSMYRDGLGVEKDYVKAKEWFGKAANQGYARAQNWLGDMYSNGLGVDKDYAKAKEWFEKAAEQEHAAAQFNLALLYGRGYGVDKNYQEAAKWYKKAANQGHAVAQNNLGTAYYNGQGVKQNYAKAKGWYEKASHQGCVNAQTSLGNMYRNGSGVEKDYVKAKEWFEKAAVQGHAGAQNNLGAAYYNGQGVEKDYAKAVEWFEKAANQEYPAAQNWLGNLYSNGQGVEKDYAKARKWYKKAAKAGYANTQFKLGNMYYYGQGIEKDYVKAKEWYEKAAHQEHAWAQYNLGNMYKKGEGV